MKWNFILLVSLIGISCEKSSIAPKKFELMGIPNGFPPIESPKDNEFTTDRWALGKKLFYDPILSRDSTISCSSCHLQEFSFSTDDAKSIGINNRIGNRNSPPLFNLAYHPYFTREGGVETLEMQVLIPIQEHDEMDFNIVLISELINEIPEYVSMSQIAYNKNPDPYVITRALANFERSLISGNSEYDKFTRDEIDLTPSQKRGMKLFNSDELACSKCHNGINFTNYQFANNGLYSNYSDLGRYRLTKDSSDLSVFKIPSLRNIEVSGPYMHDGSVTNLENVILHYSNGGVEHINKSEYINGFDISQQEINDLISFLHTLTDHEFLNNKIFIPD